MVKSTENVCDFIDFFFVMKKKELNAISRFETDVVFFRMENYLII